MDSPSTGLVLDPTPLPRAGQLDDRCRLADLSIRRVPTSEPVWRDPIGRCTELNTSRPARPSPLLGVRAARGFGASMRTADSVSCTLTSDFSLLQNETEIRISFDSM